MFRRCLARLPQGKTGRRPGIESPSALALNLRIDQLERQLRHLNAKVKSQRSGPDYTVANSSIPTPDQHSSLSPDALDDGVHHIGHGLPVGTLAAGRAMRAPTLGLPEDELRMVAPSKAVPTEVAAEQAAHIEGDEIELDFDGAPLKRIGSAASADLYQFYSMLPMTRYTMQNLMALQTRDDLLNYAQNMWREFNVRLAQRTVSLSTAPYGLAVMPSIGHLKRWYELSFQDIRTQFPKPPETDEDLVRFDDLLRKIFRRHGNTAYLFGHGMMEFAQREGWSERQLKNPELYRKFHDMETFFFDFVTTRVSLRFLIQHYLECSERLLRLSIDPKAKTEVDPLFGHESCSFIGAICKDCKIPIVVQHAIADAKREAEEDNFCDIPEIRLKIAGNDKLGITASPAMCHNIVSALVGDAIRRNTLLTCRTGAPPTPIDVVISQYKGNSEVVVSVSDTAGGIPHNLLPYATSYIYSVRGFYEDRAAHGTTPSGAISKPQGWMKSSVRLPYAKAAAQAFGGDVTIASIDGYMTDRHYYIPCVGFDQVTV